MDISQIIAPLFHFFSGSFFFSFSLLNSRSARSNNARLHTNYPCSGWGRKKKLAVKNGRLCGIDGQRSMFTPTKSLQVNSNKMSKLLQIMLFEAGFFSMLLAFNAHLRFGRTSRFFFFCFHTVWVFIVATEFYMHFNSGVAFRVDTSDRGSI